MHRPRPLRALVIAAVLAFGAAPLRAQISPDSLGWRFTASAGYVQTSGNTKVSSVSLDDRLIFRPSTRWQFTQTAFWTYARTDTVETANQLVGRLRGDYFLGPRLSMFGLGGYEQNRFAGIASRYEGSLGLAWQAVRAPKHEADVEAGASYNSQKSTTSTLDDFVAARLAGRYRYNLTGTSYVQESAELLSNLEDTGDQRVNSLTALVAPLSSRIAIRVSYLIRYDAEPAETAIPGVYFEKLDTTFSTGLQFTF